MALEGELTPILVQMVKSANMNGLLDSDSDSLSSCQQRVKARLHEILQKDRDFTAEDYEKVGLGASSLSFCLQGQLDSVFLFSHSHLFNLCYLVVYLKDWHMFCIKNHITNLLCFVSG